MRTGSLVNSVGSGSAGQALVGNAAHEYPSASPDTMRITRVKHYPTKSAIKGGSTSGPGSEYH